MYSSTLPSTSTLDGVGGQRHAPAALPPWKTRYPLYSRLGVPQGRSGPVRKISPSPEFDPRTVPPVASRYTEWAVAGHRVRSLLYIRSSRKHLTMNLQYAMRQIWHPVECVVEKVALTGCPPSVLIVSRQHRLTNVPRTYHLLSMTTY